MSPAPLPHVRAVRRLQNSDLCLFLDWEVPLFYQQSNTCDVENSKLIGRQMITAVSVSSSKFTTIIADDKIQMQKGSNERLFILTRTHSMQILGESPLSSHKTSLKQQINGYKRWKMKAKDFTLPKQDKSFSFIFHHF